MKEAELQAGVLKFLGEPATHGNRQVRRIDTHANIVFLAGDRALKVKRAVRFPFLDYSTLAKREVACASELEVNRAFAPELCRRVVPITRNSDGQFALDGDGETVEWAVEMLRFGEGQTLDRIAATCGINDALAQKLASTVSAMHTRMPVIEADSWIAALEDFLEQNAAAFREQPALFPPRSRKGSIGRRILSSDACVFSLPIGAGGASSADAMAIFTSAILLCWKGVRCRATAALRLQSSKLFQWAVPLISTPL